VTSSDVARRAGVSRATVSAVINKTRPVSDKLVKRVGAVMRELNYQPNAIARSLKAKRTYRIGLLVGNSASPFWALAINAIEGVAYNQGFHVMLGDSGEDPTKELVHLQMMASERVDGIIVAPCGETNREYILQLATQIPVVFFDRRFDAPIDTVACDNEFGAYLATCHFLELGFNKIACLAISLDVSPGAERLAGYKKALIEHGIPLNEHWIKVGDYAEGSGYRDTMELLRSPDPPRAIFACSHLRAVGVLQAVSELGLLVPEDVALIGFDEVPWAALLSPPLTVVYQPIADMAAQATELLLKRIEAWWEGTKDADIVEQILHRPKLIIRESCGCCLVS